MRYFVNESKWLYFDKDLKIENGNILYEKSSHDRYEPKTRYFSTFDEAKDFFDNIELKIVYKRKRIYVDYKIIGTVDDDNNYTEQQVKFAFDTVSIERLNYIRDCVLDELENE